MATPKPPEVSLLVRDADAALDRLAGLLQDEDPRASLASPAPCFSGVVRPDRIVLDLVPAEGTLHGGFLSPIFRGRLSEDRHGLEGRFAWSLGLKLLALLWLGWILLVVPGALVAAVGAAGAPATWTLETAEGVVPPLVGLAAALGLAWLARRHAAFARQEILAALESAASTRRR